MPCQISAVMGAMITIKATDRAGDTLKLECEEGEPLMHALRDYAGVEATCGGTASCGTCHVYVADSWYPKLSSMDEEESLLLDGLISTQDNSRVACKIIASQELEGLQITLAPED